MKHEPVGLKALIGITAIALLLIMIFIPFLEPLFLAVGVITIGRWLVSAVRNHIKERQDFNRRLEKVMKWKPSTPQQLKKKYGKREEKK